MPFSEKQIQDAWEKATVVEELNKNEWRKDAIGAYISFKEYGKDTLYGWSIDHIYPIAKGGDDNIQNLRPLQFNNNQAKANDFPEYNIVYVSEDTPKRRNIEQRRTSKVHIDVFETVKRLYRLNINYPS